MNEAHSPAIEQPNEEENTASVTRRLESNTEHSSFLNGSVRANRHIIVALILCLVGLLAGLFFGINQGPTNLRVPELASIAACQEKSLKLLDLKTPSSIDVLQQLVGHCYSEIRSQGLLNDFALRKAVDLQQYRANGVLLWMVVSITLSGVILAGLQLAASYRLAEAARAASLTTSDEISIRRDQLVLKSSVTGLFILIISFAFFLVFVFYVYKVEDRENAPQVLQQLLSLPKGGLGPPAKK